MKGRLRRTKHFEKRAKSFLPVAGDHILPVVAGKTSSKTIIRDYGVTNSGKLWVGTGQHKRLVLKTNRFHAKMAIAYYERLTQYFKERGYDPSFYKLVQPMTEIFDEINATAVQEYFNKPSLSEILAFYRMQKALASSEKVLRSRRMTMDERKVLIGKYFSGKEAYLRCKQFANDPKNKGTDLEILDQATKEIIQDQSKIGTISVGTSNTIVLGVTRPEKDQGLTRIRLAIVDY